MKRICIPHDRLLILIAPLCTKISNISDPTRSKTGAFSVHKLDHASYPTFSEVDCREIAPNDIYPHYHFTDVVFMVGRYDKCCGKMIVNVFVKDLVPSWLVCARHGTRVDLRWL
jgi:hypothetical protein